MASDMTAKDVPTQSRILKSSTTEARVLQMGPWDQQPTPEMLAGVTPLPMPVTIAHPDSLKSIFRHIEQDGDASALSDEVSAAARGEMILLQSQKDPYSVPFIEYEKGVIYADRRLDLCKMVLGPPNIETLLDSLETNTFIKHFLLGNNIIGPKGAKRIAKFIRDYPDRMDTWYLAGNCIDSAGFHDIVNGLVHSMATNIWLKRNPLGPDAAADIARLICQSRYLRTLDLDQTGLSDDGVTQLFNCLGGSGSQEHTLEHIYLNGNGLGINAAIAVCQYLTSPRCKLKSIYLSNNPLGDAGVSKLADALRKSSSIERVMLLSVGLTAQGASKLLKCLTGHKTLVSLDIGQSFATEDLKTRFNWISDDALPMIRDFILLNVSTRYLNLGMTALSTVAANEIRSIVINDHNLCCFMLGNINTHPNLRNDLLAKKLKNELRNSLARNVAEHYNGIDYATFEAEFKRGLIGPEEYVRKIDSVYRNRDAELAKRKLKVLDKWWNEDDTTLDEVMAWT